MKSKLRIWKLTLFMIVKQPGFVSIRNHHEMRIVVSLLGFGWCHDYKDDDDAFFTTLSTLKLLKSTSLARKHTTATIHQLMDSWGPTHVLLHSQHSTDELQRKPSRREAGKALLLLSNNFRTIFNKSASPWKCKLFQIHCCQVNLESPMANTFKLNWTSDCYSWSKGEIQSNSVKFPFVQNLSFLLKRIKHRKNKRWRGPFKEKYCYV